MGPLRANAFMVVLNFLRSGDLASGFLRLRCPDCGDEHLLAFTC
ncbi:MAG: transposase zinc-binding domain-containing protein [Verrucomicrobia bacterium]|nr:transposase zinc-binding domain-containing protein [Verrucomicrobiota bacterium]